jgi:hypothetical protein
MEVKQVLEEVWELGYFKIAPNERPVLIAPKFSVHKDRLFLVLQYLKDYFEHHPEEKLECFITCYDGFREHSEFSENPIFVEATPELLQLYKGKGSAGEPGRFVQPRNMKDIYPKFQLPVLAMGRHITDPNVLLIPDTDFIKSRGYVELRKEILENDIPFEDKINKIFWRGGAHGPALKTYDKTHDPPRKQRQICVDVSKENKDIFDAEFSYSTTKKEMLKYKYALDIDGEQVAWSGAYWKFLSNSVVFKVWTFWEQWYYKDLKPWVHYIPVKGDLSDIREKYEWAISNEEECKKISERATEFIKGITYESSIKEYKIQ